MSSSDMIADEKPRTMTWMDVCVSFTTFPSVREDNKQCLHKKHMKNIAHCKLNEALQSKTT